MVGSIPTGISYAFVVQWLEQVVLSYCVAGSNPVKGTMVFKRRKDRNKQAFKEIISVLGPYPWSCPCSKCEGCDFEINEALMTAINAYTGLPWSRWDETSPMKKVPNTGEGIMGKWEQVSEPKHTAAERYAWWASHGMASDPREEYKHLWHIKEHVDHIRKRIDNKQYQ